jgi:hypothetical protein
MKAKTQTSFARLIERYSARHIAAAIGCSLPTAYDWRSGRRSPPAWLHTRYLDDLATYQLQVSHEQKTA